MQTERLADAAPPQSPLAVPVVPSRSARRSTAHRASNRRATAREHKDEVEGRILDYLKDHPHSTTGEMAKGLNADRAAVATGIAHMLRAGEIAKNADGQIAIIHASSDQ
jgi:predicted transcriptional regulator